MTPAPRGGLRRLAALLSDPRTPKLPRIAVALAALYVLWPVDLIPEITPLIGFLDDLTVVWVALRWLIKSDPEGRGAPEPPLPR